MPMIQILKFIVSFVWGSLMIGTMVDWGHAQKRGTEDYSRALQVVVFQGQNIESNPSWPPTIRALPNAELPEIISKAIVLQSGSAVPELNQFDLPDKVMFLDIHTLELSDQVIRKSKSLKHKNWIANLQYAVKVCGWSEDACEIQLTGKYEKAAVPPIEVKLSKQTTVLVAVNGDSRLYFAFTFLSAIGFLPHRNNPGNSDGLCPPEVVLNPTPPFPEEPIRGRKNGLFSVVTVIRKEGKADPARWVVRECDHPSFARSATGTILEKWEFKPGLKNNKVVEFIATIEVKYTLH